MVNTVRCQVSIDNLIVGNMNARCPNANDIKTNPEKSLVAREGCCGGGWRENRLRELSLTQSIIDNVRSGERVASKPGKTSLVKLDSVQNLLIPRESNIITVNHRSRILDEYDLGGETAALRRSSTARRTRAVNRIIRY
jgi:hypothetical protein